MFQGIEQASLPEEAQISPNRLARINYGIGIAAFSLGAAIIATAVHGIITTPDAIYNSQELTRASLLLYDGAASLVAAKTAVIRGVFIAYRQ